MTPDKTPTDAELQSAYDLVPAHGNQQDVHIAGLRAVLAKWGSPVVAGEPFCYVSVNKQGDATRTIMRKDRWSTIPLYLAPQPTQAQAGAVPLTDGQIKDEASHHGFIGSTEMLVKFVRGIEAAHGIKEGGQHGTE